MGVERLAIPALGDTGVLILQRQYVASVLCATTGSLPTGETRDLMGLQKKDVRIATLAAGIAFLLVGQQVAGKAVRDALFLTAYGPELLPIAMTVTVAVAIGSVLASSRLVVWFGPRRFLMGGVALSGGLFIVSALRAEESAGDAGWLLYGHIAVFGSIISGFWSIVTEALNPSSGRKLISRVSFGATLGGLSGAGLAKGAASLLGSSGCLWVLAGMALLSGVLAGWLPKGTSPVEKEQAALPQSTGGSRRYLAWIGAFLFATALAAALSDYILKVEASRLYEQDEASLLSFFATFYTAVSLLTVLVQALASRPVLERFGLTVAAGTLPGAVMVTSVFALLTGHWLFAVSIRAADSVAGNSLFRSGYELLYTPVDVGTKRRFKSAIDVGAVRAGDLVAAGVLLWVGTSVQTAPLVAACAVLSAVALFLLRFMHSGYVRTLTQQLQRGTVNLPVGAVSDLTTLRTLSEATATLDRTSLLEGIRAYEAQQRLSPAPPKASSLSREMLVEFRALETHETLDAVQLLSDGELGSLATQAIRFHLRRDQRALVEVMVDASVSVAARGVLGRLLTEHPTRWVERALLTGLAHRDRATRNVCAEALSRVDSLAHQADIRPLVLSYIDEEVRIAVDAGPEGSEAGLQRVFRLLASAFDRRQVLSASKGFFSEDPKLVGSALELISTAVSPDLARRLERIRR